LPPSSATQRSLDIFRGEILHKDDWLTEKVIDSLILHAPEDVVWCPNCKGKFAAVIQQNMHIEIIVLWVALGQF
jgi:hypothetical protein